MPTVYSTLVEVDQSISRPAVVEIINQVQDITKIDKDVEIRYPGDSQKTQTPSSSIDYKTDRFAKFGTDKYLFIEVNEDYDKTAITSTAISKGEHIEIFKDSKLNVSIVPIYATTNVSIDFNYRTVSKTEALSWRDDMRMKLSHMRDINLHKLHYHYMVPDEFLTLLKEIHRLRENKLGYGQDLRSYLTDMFSNRLTPISDITGSEFELSISETQIRIVGMYDFDALPEKIERDEESGTYLIKFSYKFNYEKPIACVIRYPLMVHNQILDQKYTHFVNKNYIPNKDNLSFSNSLEALHFFEGDSIMESVPNIEGQFRIPPNDDYVLNSKQYATATVFIALCEVDEVDKKTLLNLKELGDVYLNQDVLDFISKTEYPYVCDIFKSIINISLYRNSFLVRDNSLTCDSNLNIRSKEELNLRNQYRVRFSLIIDLSILRQNVFERLLRNTLALVSIIGSLNNLINNSPDFEVLKNSIEGNLSSKHFTKIYRLIMTGVYHQHDKTYYSPGLGISPLDPSYYIDKEGYKQHVGLFKDLDDDKVEDFRSNRITFNTVAVSGIIALRRE